MKKSRNYLDPKSAPRTLADDRLVEVTGGELKAPRDTQSGLPSGK